MPPPIAPSDESDNESMGEIAAKASAPKSETKSNGKSKRKAGAVEPVNGADDDDEGVEEENDDGEEVYDVESIEGHEFRGKKQALYLLVKWLGYDDPADRTWELEDTLVEDASDIVGKYYEAQGGRPVPPSGKKGASKAAAKAQSEDRPTKRQKKGAEIEDDHLPRRTIWDNDIEEVVSLHRTPEGNLRVMIRLKSGHDVEVSSDTAYKRFPQTMLNYYESKLSFHPS